MAVSTRALSLFDSVTYPRRADAEALTAAQGSRRREPAATEGLQPKRLADLNTLDARLAMLC